jgi:hypothetical protein
VRLETIDLGIEMSARERARVVRSLAAALNGYADRMRLVRVRLFRAGRRGMVRCKIRAWHGADPTIVVSAVRPTVEEAVVEAAENLDHAIRRRSGRGAGHTRRRSLQKPPRRARGQGGGAA